MHHELWLRCIAGYARAGEGVEKGGEEYRFFVRKGDLVAWGVMVANPDSMSLIVQGRQGSPMAAKGVRVELLKNKGQAAREEHMLRGLKFAALVWALSVVTLLVVAI